VAVEAVFPAYFRWREREGLISRLSAVPTGTLVSNGTNERAGIEFEWDKANIAHLARHQVTPIEAEQVIVNDPVESDLYWVESEERVTAVGPTDAGRFLHVVITLRGSKVRCVTAYEASQREVRAWLHQKGLLQ
jgi:uncharacterized DUF497 family protein